MIKVCLIDDQTLVRQGIKSLLGLVDDITVISEASDGLKGLEQLKKQQPDVILLDLRMPVLDGIGLLKKMREQGLSIPVLILTTFDDDALLLEALKSGAKGYLLKDVSLEQLSNAIRTLHEGKTLIQPALTERIMHGLSRLNELEAMENTSLIAPETLTERETEVLRLMAGGYSNKEIAKALELSEGTVKNHVSSVLSKFGVRDRTRAVLQGLAFGLL